MKTTSKLLTLLIFFFTGIIFIIVDISINNSWGAYFQIFPIFFLLILFVSLYSKYRWWYVFFMLLFYVLVGYQLILNAFLIILFIFAFDFLIDKIFQKRTLFYYLSYALFLNLIFYLNKKLNPLILTKIANWKNLDISWYFSDYHQIITLIIITEIFVLLFYPLLSWLDSKRNIYMNS